MSTSIRSYRPDDKSRLVEIFHLNVPKHFGIEELKGLESYLDKPPETYYVIEVDNKVVGASGCAVEENLSGTITWIFLHPESAGQGLGRALVEHCLAILKKDDRVKKFRAKTSQTAYKFFERMGFSLIRTEKDYWAKGLDLYDMEMLA